MDAHEPIDSMRSTLPVHTTRYTRLEALEAAGTLHHHQQQRLQHPPMKQQHGEPRSSPMKRQPSAAAAHVKGSTSDTQPASAAGAKGKGQLALGSGSGSGWIEGGAAFWEAAWDSPLGSSSAGAGGGGGDSEGAFIAAAWPGINRVRGTAGGPGGLSRVDSWDGAEGARQLTPLRAPSPLGGVPGAGGKAAVLAEGGGGGVPVLAGWPRAQVVRFEVVTVGGKDAAVYNILAGDDNGEWTISRRCAGTCTWHARARICVYACVRACTILYMCVWGGHVRC